MHGEKEKNHGHMLMGKKKYMVDSGPLFLFLVIWTHTRTPSFSFSFTSSSSFRPSFTLHSHQDSYKQLPLATNQLKRKDTQTHTHKTLETRTSDKNFYTGLHQDESEEEDIENIENDGHHHSPVSLLLCIALIVATPECY